MDGDNYYWAVPRDSEVDVKVLRCDRPAALRCGTGGYYRFRLGVGAKEIQIRLVNVRGLQPNEDGRS